MRAFERWMMRCGLCLGLVAMGGVQDGSAQATRAIYLVSHGWHAGIVVERAHAPTARWPEQQDFPDAAFLEVGWGDAAYYQTPDPGLGTLLKAGLWPTPSVLHVVGFRQPVTVYFPNSEIVRVELPQAGVDSLAAFIHAAYARDEEGRVLPLGPGLYGESRFYAARERYHVFKNCNVWTARALRAAGAPITSANILTVGDLMARVRTFGEVIQEVVSPGQ